MNFANTLPQTEAEFFDEKGLLKEYRPSAHFDERIQQQHQHTGSMFVLKKVQNLSNAILFSDNGIEIQHSVPGPDPTPDFPFQEFPLTEVVSQSKIDISSISDTSDPRETNNSSRKATKSTDSSLKSGLNNRSHDEMRKNRDLTVSD